MTPLPPAAALLDLWGGKPAQPLPAVLSALERRGVVVPPAEFRRLLLEPDLDHLMMVEVRDPELVLDVPRVLTGRVFTHRLTAAEKAAGSLVLLPDLVGLWPVLGLPQFDELDGQPLGDDVDDDTGEDVLVLPPSALIDHPAGTLLALSVGPEGLSLSAAAEPTRESLAPVLDALTASWAACSAGRFFDGVVQLDEFVLVTCVEHADAFTAPGWPLSDLLNLLDLDHSEGLVAAAGFDFDAAAEAGDQAAELDRIADSYELPDEEAAGVQAFVRAVDEVHDWLHEQDDDDQLVELPRQAVADLGPVAAMLAEPMVAVAIAEERLTDDPHFGRALQLILEAVQQDVPRRAMAGWNWLSARCADVLGDVPAAEVLHQRALALDADFYPALRDLATLASLRGDAGAAVSLLLRAGVPADDPELAVLTPFVGEARADIGRNEQCWCGSGRKYKRCHLGRSDFDLAARRGWVLHKLTEWARTGYGRGVLLDLAAAAADPEAGIPAYLAAIESPLVMDVALFEGGLLADFLDTRSDALPADELQLLTGWADRRRGLYTVGGGSSAGWSLTEVVAADVPTPHESAVHLVELPAGSAAPQPGDLVCARLLEVDGGPTTAAGFAVVGADRQDDLHTFLSRYGGEADPAELVELLTARAAAVVEHADADSA